MFSRFSPILLLFILFSCASVKTTTTEKFTNDENFPLIYDFKYKLEANEIEFLRKNYNWQEEDILIINFRQPRNFCHYDNNKVSKKTIKWWNDFYSKINIENCLNVFVYSENSRSLKNYNQQNYFLDKEKFIFMNFFNKKRSCDGVLIINKNGDYFQHGGHYSEKQVAKLISVLKAEL